MNVAVIGTGQIGLIHVRIYSSLRNVKLVAVCELNKELGERISNEYKVKHYSDYKKLIANEKLDLVSICIPTSAHYKIARYFIENNISTLIEKPITLNVKEAEELLELASKKRVKLFVGHIERFNPAVIKLKKMIDQGELGEIIAVIARRVGGFPPRAIDSNIAVDLAIHDIDIINYLLNDLPSSIKVNKQKNFSIKEDSVEFFLKYKKTSAYIQANWVTPVKIRKLNITGTRGYVEMDYISQKIDFYKSNFKKFNRRFESFSDYVLEFSEADIENVSVVKKEPLREELKYFIKCVKNDTKINAMFAVEALKISLYR